MPKLSNRTFDKVARKSGNCAVSGWGVFDDGKLNFNIAYLSVSHAINRHELMNTKLSINKTIFVLLMTMLVGHSLCKTDSVIFFFINIFL